METENKESNVMKKFFALCALASEAEDVDMDRYLEPEYSLVLDHMIAFPAFRRRFGEELLMMVEFPGEISSQLVEYCMHELRWPEVKASTEIKLKAADDPRSQSVFNHILEAFEDDWDDEGYERWKPFEQ